MGQLLTQRDDWAGAERWWRRGADAGEPKSMYGLGIALDRRVDGEAERWFRRAQDAGYTP